MILFVIVWLLTFGKVTFWLLPNLTEDVGFFESFRPTYRCEFKDASKKDEKEGATDDAQKDGAALEKDGAENHSDGEEAGDNEEQEDDKAKEDGGSEEEEDEEDERERVDEEEEEEDEIDDQEENGHSAISSDNGYEIVNADDVEVLGQADLEGSEEDDDQAQETKSQKRSKKGGKNAESKKTK